ncbi:MAG: hypothetical protein M3R53_09870 [Candidatus Eremiobacteraeota bacterium]|nr:hypothetical protein [Candidatus Eremiobacteraeota bacterium]
MLRGHASFEALLLKSRAALRCGNGDAALAALASIDDRACSERERGELFTLRGAASTLARRFDEAACVLQLARVYAFGAACAELEAEFEFTQSALHFAVGEIDLAEAAARSALDVRQPRFRAPGDYFVPLAQTRARACNMRGVVAAAREDFATQLFHARDTLRELEQAPEADAWFWAAALMQLAFHVRDFDLMADAAFLRRAVAEVRWSDEMARMQFEIHRALGWSSALCGDDLSAFRSFRLCVDIAPTQPWKIIAYVDRASLGRELHERHSAREEIEYAAALADCVDWNDVGEERIGLAQLAGELAAFAPARAGAILSRYRAIGSHLSPYALHNVMRHPRAYENMAEGAVSLALGNNGFAVVNFLAAFDIFDELGYQWLAARAAIELAELDAGERFAEYARCEAQLRPGSWLARRVAGLP